MSDHSVGKRIWGKSLIRKCRWDVRIKKPASYAKRQRRVEYHEYMASDEWRKFRARYYASDWPDCCLACGEAKTTLHHMTYTRLGVEQFRDVAPLCWPCHEKLHRDSLLAGKGGVSGFIGQLGVVFGISRADARAKMQKWLEEVPSDKKLKTKEAKEKRRRKKIAAEMARNRKVHELNCDSRS